MYNKLRITARKVRERIKRNKTAAALAAVYILLGTAGVALAITAPTSGTFAYDVYDIGVNKILDGPIGFVAGVAAMAVGAVSAVQQKVFASVPAILGGAVLLNADSLVTSLGMIC